MRRRVSKLAGEYWWEKEEIFLGRGDELGLESIVIIGLLYLYEHCCPGLAGWCPLRGAVSDACQARGSTSESGASLQQQANPCPTYRAANA